MIVLHNLKATVSGFVIVAWTVSWVDAGALAQSDKPPQAARVAGRIGKTYAESVPFKAAPPEARPGAPNILVWMIDDVGFGQLGCYGGLVDTPNLDRIARSGLRYTNYHTTPICSASRAAFLTGRNPHAVHVGSHAYSSIGFPGYDARVPADAGTIAANLHKAGYMTFALGKWDHLPSEQTTAAGPYTYWPLGQGFDRFYGFLSGDADNFHPVLWADNQAIEAPRNPNYHLSADLADHAILMINALKSAPRQADVPPRPFFMYWATGASHAPHQAPEAYLKHYRGRFDMGWDKARERILAHEKARGLIPGNTQLPPRPEGMPAWDTLTADQKRSYARAMEAFAAQLTHADHEFGRILDALEANGELDNTLVIVLSDNGASAEGGPNGSYREVLYVNGHPTGVEENLKHYDEWGGPQSFPNYPVGWAAAGDTPYRYYKQTAYEGGVHVPLIIAWPKAIADHGGVRAQFHFADDITPTILEAAGVGPAAEINGVPQRPFQGVSMAYTFASPQAPSRKKVQYFELWGNRALWADGWKAVVPHRLRTWDLSAAPPITDGNWELYDLNVDIGEQHNLAAEQPARLKRMISLFDQQARLNNVYPIHNHQDAANEMRAQAEEEFLRRKGQWTYRGPVSRIPEVGAPPILNRSYRMTASIDVSSAPANGVLFAMGGVHGGLSLYLMDGHPVFVFKNIDLSITRIAGSGAIPAGASTLQLDFERTVRGARVRLAAGGTELAQGEITGPIPPRFSVNETFDIGSDDGTSPSTDYESPFRFTGTLKELLFDFSKDAKQRAERSKIDNGAPPAQGRLPDPYTLSEE